MHALFDYNAHLNGVDIHDQKRMKYDWAEFQEGLEIHFWVSSKSCHHKRFQYFMTRLQLQYTNANVFLILIFFVNLPLNSLLDSVPENDDIMNERE